MIYLAVPLCVVASVFWLRRRTRRHDSRGRLDAVPMAIDLVIAVIRSGGTPHDAVAILGDHGPRAIERDLLVITGRVHAGETITEAARDCSSDLRPLFEVLSAGERLGVPIESLLFQLAADARAARRRADDESARRLPVRLSLPLVACTLPSFVLVVIAPVLIGALQQLRS